MKKTIAPPPRQRPTHSYIGRAACGCVVAVVSDTRDNLRGVANAVAEFIRDGLIVERVEHSYVRDNPFGCHCPTAAQEGMDL